MNLNAPESGLATLLASRGRGDDTMLIHMTPGEVHGLQRLAMAHGGSLTLNPHTGLPEAGILKSLLPALIGFGLTFTGLGPLAAAGIVGAGETIRTKGDLGKGLMAGLGAFGGAGLGAGLTAAGTQAAAGAAGLGAAGNAPAAFISGGQQALQAGTQAAATEAAKQGALATMGQGVKALGTEAGRSAFMGAVPGGVKGIAAGATGLAGAMTPEYKMPDVGDVDSPYWESYGYDEGEGRFLGGRWLPSYPGLPKKKGKGMADGGIVDPNRDPGGTVIPAPASSPAGSALNPNVPLAEYLQNLNQFVTSPVTPQRSAQPTQPSQPTTPSPRNPRGSRWDQGLSQFGAPPQFGNVNLGGLAGLARARNIDQFLNNVRGGGTGSTLIGTEPMNDFSDMDAPPAYELPPAWGEPSFTPPAYEPPPQNYDWLQPEPYMAALTPYSAPQEIEAQPESTPYMPSIREEEGPPLPSMPQPKVAPSYEPPAQMYQPAPSYEPPAQMYQPAPSYEPPAQMYQPTPFSEPQSYESIMPVDDYFGSPYSFENSDARMFAAGGPTQYAAGGKYLRGPGDGMSDDIKANIEGKQEARLADGEFVIPADVVSHLGNGSSEAGSRRLYKMMADIRKARTGTHKQAPAVKAERFMPG